MGVILDSPAIFPFSSWYDFQSRSGIGLKHLDRMQKSTDKILLRQEQYQLSSVKNSPKITFANPLIDHQISYHFDPE